MARVNVVVSTTQKTKEVADEVVSHIGWNLPLKDYLGSRMVFSRDLGGERLQQMTDDDVGQFGGGRNDVIRVLHRDIAFGRRDGKGFCEQRGLFEILGPDGDLILDISLIVAKDVDKVLDSQHLSGSSRKPVGAPAAAPVQPKAVETQLLPCLNPDADIDFDSMKNSETDPVPARLKIILANAGIRINGDLLNAMENKVHFTLAEWNEFMGVLKAKNPEVRYWLPLSHALNTWLSEKMGWIYPVSKYHTRA